MFLLRYEDKFTMVCDRPKVNAQMVRVNIVGFLNLRC
jgi:hypothetical protein